MPKDTGYYVIGGQYACKCYGWSKTLQGAKVLATRHEEYWDNHIGWRKPRIWAAADCEEVNNFYGEQIAPVRDRDVRPAAIWDEFEMRWRVM